MADLNASVEEYLAGLSDEDWRALSARVRPPTDPASARASLAQKANAMWETPRDRNGVVGSMAAATAARQPHPQSQPPVETQQFQPPPDTGYTGSDTLRRTPFVTPITTPTEIR
ncbi:MAG TPA: hypothetical protein VKG83_14645 [Mycobacterium sp.]|nr:hypothetical protein [Mycobacterium sp.]